MSDRILSCLEHRALILSVRSQRQGDRGKGHKARQNGHLAMPLYTAVQFQRCRTQIDVLVDQIATLAHLYWYFAGDQLETTSPNLYCAQLMLPSFMVQSLLPRSSPAAPPPTKIGRRCSNVGCAFLASDRCSKLTMADSLSSGVVSTASFSASSKVLVYGNGSELPTVNRKSLRLWTAIPDTTITIPCCLSDANAFPRR